MAVTASCADPEDCREAVFDDEVDWDQLISLSNQHLVAPAVWTALSQLRPLHQVPEDVQDYLALLHERNAHRNARIHQQCVEIGRALADKGIRAVLLKGAAWLFDGNSAAASDRMMRDIDILVDPDRIDDAANVLLGTGYHHTGESAGHFHHAPLTPKNGEALVEIHRDLSFRPTLLPSREMLDAANEVADGLLLPTTRHRIMHNVIHAQIENGNFVGGIVDLRDALDLARLTTHQMPDSEWVSAAASAAERGYFSRLSGAAHSVHRVLQSPMPEALRSFRGAVHGWRCANQRLYPSINKTFESFGTLSRALAWEHDAYPLGLGTERSLTARFLVNRRRAQRAKASLRGRLGLEVSKFFGRRRNGKTELKELSVHIDIAKAGTTRPQAFRAHSVLRFETVIRQADGNFRRGMPCQLSA